MDNKEISVQVRNIVNWVIKNTKYTSQAKIAEKLGVHRTSISSAVNGKGGYATDSFVGRLREAFPESPYSNYNIPIKPSTVNDSNNLYSNPSKTQTVPLLPILAYGGSLNQFVTSLKDSDCEYIISPVEGAELAITVTGESMSPKYRPGSKIYLQRINEEAFIDWGKEYVLDTCNGTVLKVLVPGSSEDCIKCLSLNPDPIYAPFEVCKKDIYGVYRILMLTSLQ